MTEHFPSLPEATLAAANRLGQWLALDDFTVQASAVDIVVLAGNAVIPTIDAACRLAADVGVPLLISGGVGHSTVFLYDAVRNDPRYRSVPVDGRPEAHILADIAHRFWHIPRDKIVVEDRSTNCGENALYPREAGGDGIGSSRRRRAPGSDDAAADHGDVCPRLAGRGGHAAVVQYAGLRAAAGQYGKRAGFLR
jgi:hypothetical protein